MNDYVSMSEAANVLRLTRMTVQYHVANKNLPAIRVNGKCWLIRKSDLERFQVTRR